MECVRWTGCFFCMPGTAGITPPTSRNCAGKWAGSRPVARFAGPRVRWSVRRTHESTRWNVRYIRDFAGQYRHAPVGEGSAQNGGQFHRPGGREQGIQRRNEREETEEELLRWLDVPPCDS